MTKQTPLYHRHVACGARMVDFHGWMMPLNYGSQIDEHHAVRQHAGMFDVSHMLNVDVQGEDAVYVSRLRQDASVENGFSFWSVADNLRAGVAKNAFGVMKLMLAEKQ